MKDTSPVVVAGRCRVILLAELIAMIVLWSVAAPRRAPLNDRPIRCTVNPNTAPWWELASLPRVGRSMARRIIRARVAAGADTASGTGARTFRRSADLSTIRGIGPVTLHRIGRYLDFGSG